MRLFGANLSEQDVTPSSLRPVQAVVQRLLWDGSLNKDEFSFVYEDRYEGLKEMPGSISDNFFHLVIMLLVSSPNVNVKGKERLLIRAVPPHRIKAVKYRDRMVWDKNDRIDCFFGSLGESKIEEVIASYGLWSEEQKSKRKKMEEEVLVFVDLDGVLVDFDAGVRKIFGRNPSEIAPKTMWPRLARTPGFYDTLSWTNGGKELWEALRPYKPTICSGLPLGTWAGPQKMSWCRRELGEEVKVILCKSREKSLHCKGPRSILIDDRKEIGEAWDAAGGVFIHHVDSMNTIELFMKRKSELLQV